MYVGKPTNQEPKRMYACVYVFVLMYVCMYVCKLTAPTNADPSAKDHIQCLLQHDDCRAHIAALVCTETM
jgi:hypothetical protein